jgi:hypothetical protein
LCKTKKGPPLEGTPCGQDKVKERLIFVSCLLKKNCANSMPLLRSGASKDFARQSENERKWLVLSLKIPEMAIGALGLNGIHVPEPVALEFVSAPENATIPRNTRTIKFYHVRRL